MQKVGGSHRKQGNNKRAPRMNGPASKCIVRDLATGEVVGEFSPRRPLKRTSVIVQDNGKLIVKVTDL